DQPDRLTMHQEYRLGRAWLRQYRAASPVIYDPIMQNYLETLVNKLAVEAELYERRLNLIAINAKTINAFAVPGGVIGVHSALLLKAKDEDMVASVLAHELAHLSQRHYARRKDNAEGQQLSLLTAMLTGLVLSA
ncbi:M48 family metallopeptidase, partial [Oceanospirillum multiglobuliferum]